MIRRCILLAVMCCFTLVLGQDGQNAPTNEKALKLFREGAKFEERHETFWALDRYRKADRQEGGNCVACELKMIQLGIDLGDWKAAETAAAELAEGAWGEKNAARAHYLAGLVWYNKGTSKKSDEMLSSAHGEMIKALAASPDFSDAVFVDGRVLARLRQDDAARARFEQYVKMTPGDDPDRPRALRYAARPELARARMAPSFVVTTSDGTRISLDDLQGKVVLLDFWATWCAPCQNALPHMKKIVRKFQGQSLVVLSVSLDSDERKWREFISKNEMSWPQYMDGGFTGRMATLFGVKAIPHTFTIDADGVLQEEHVGDAAIEGKIKKLLAQVQETRPPSETSK